MGSLLLELVEQNQEQAAGIAALATQVAKLEDQNDRSSREFLLTVRLPRRRSLLEEKRWPPSTHGPGQRGSGNGGFGGGIGDGKRRQRGGQKGHPGHGRDLLPSERCDQGFDHVPDHCGS